MGALKIFLDTCGLQHLFACHTSKFTHWVRCLSFLLLKVTDCQSLSEDTTGLSLPSPRPCFLVFFCYYFFNLKPHPQSSTSNMVELSPTEWYTEWVNTMKNSPWNTKSWRLNKKGDKFWTEAEAWKNITAQDEFLWQTSAVFWLKNQRRKNLKIKGVKEGIPQILCVNFTQISSWPLNCVQDRLQQKIN